MHKKFKTLVWWITQVIFDLLLFAQFQQPSYSMSKDLDVSVLRQVIKFFLFQNSLSAASLHFAKHALDSVVLNEANLLPVSLSLSTS